MIGPQFMALLRGFLFLLLHLLMFCHGHKEKDKKSKVLMISFDGFRYDYLSKAAAANKNITSFRHLWERGVRAEYMQNVFSTRTFANHFTLVTGLYEESHGIVDNVFYDPEYKEVFSIANDTQSVTSKWFDTGAEPIWVTNQKNDFYTGTVYWPCSNARIKGYLPSFTLGVYNHNVPLEYRIDRVVDWLSIDRTNLALLYFEEPDSTGHAVGPNRVEILNVIERLNLALDYLLRQLAKHPHLQEVLNIILVSDHGMTDIVPSLEISVDNYIDPTLYDNYHPPGSPLWGLWPKSGKDNEVHQKAKTIPNIDAYNHSEIPEGFRYKNNRRISPILLVAHEGGLLYHSNSGNKTGGSHGYNNSLASMHPFFIASGPAFRQNETVRSVHSVDIYLLLCHLLKLHNPAPNNGSWSRIETILRLSGQDNQWLDSTFITCVLSIAFAALISAYLSLVVIRSSRSSTSAAVAIALRYRALGAMPASAGASSSGSRLTVAATGQAVPKDIQHLLTSLSDEDDDLLLEKSPTNQKAF